MQTQSQTESVDSSYPLEKPGASLETHEPIFAGKNLRRFADILVYLREDLDRMSSEALPSNSLLRTSLLELRPEMIGLTNELEDWQACVMILLQQLSNHLDARVSRFAAMALKHMTEIHQKSNCSAPHPIH